MSGRGFFIVLEGGEGCGKSTQSALLAERIDALLTRQPGGTAVGAELRRLLLSNDTVGLVPRAEALLMAADRAQHVAEVIRPALEAGRHVVCDRYTGSSVAYQGGGRGLDPADVRNLSAWAAEGCAPDLVVLLVVPEEVATARLGGSRDRFEAEGSSFHARVLDSFARQAAEDPQRWAVVDGNAAVDVVAERVWAEVAGRLRALAAR